MPGKDTNIGAKRAREARDQLGLGYDAPVGCLLTQSDQGLGLPVLLIELSPGFAGCCWRDGAGTVLWVNGADPPVRQRFTLAHEIGHNRCGHDASVPAESFETLSGKTTDSREIQANAFAAELLAPAAGVRAAVKGEPSLETVVKLAYRYGISTIAALYRLNTLELISGRRSRRLREEIEEGLDGELAQRLGLEPPDDVIARLRPHDLPHLSPTLANSALAGVLSGSVAVEDAARAAGCDPAALADATAMVDD
jgi:Zn-dependent peptidase ImmA (M78 family)